MINSREQKIGSVQFFKRVICFTVAACLLSLTILCILLGMQNHTIRQELRNIKGEAETDSMMHVWALEGAAVEEPEQPAYQTLYPNLYCDAGKSFTDASGIAYLTFDDGPSPRTPEILEILKTYDIKATFFVVGRTDEESKAWMRRIVEEGHTLAIHTYSHSYKEIYQSVDNFLADFNAIYELIYESTGVKPEIFRFPGGSVNAYNQELYQEIIAEMLRRGFTYYDWNASTGDATSKQIAAAQIAGSALAGAAGKNNCILLAHDSAGKTSTVAALPAIIEGLAEMGYTFDRLTPEVRPVCFGYQD